MRTRKATQALILGFFVYGSTKVFRGLVSPTLTKIPLPNVATASTSRQTSPQQPLARLAKSIKSPPLPKIKSPPLPKIKTTHETKPVFPRTLIPFKLHQQGATGSSFSLSMPASFDRVQLDGRMIEHVKWIDEEILVFIGKYYPQYLSLYKTLPHHIYRADLARYMLLNTFGGLYSDTDTYLIKDYKDWIPQTAPSNTIRFIVGLEADSIGREDWAMWFAREFQWCQWTFASVANHPILDWAIKKAFDRLQSSPPPDRDDPTFQNAVLSLTGPGLFTDAVFWYLDSEFGIGMKDLKGLDEPRTIGDVLILPQTAFSPEMPHIHSYSNSHPNSLVKHMFSGSWKSPSRS